MPLAIELAAARVRSIAPAQMLERLLAPGTPRLELLARPAGRGGALARHASMQRTIEWSWNLLEPRQARALSALTVFVGGFTAAAAATLWTEDPLDAACLLDELVAHSMVHVRDADDEGMRFRLYEPIREFVAARLDEAARPGRFRGRRRCRPRCRCRRCARRCPTCSPRWPRPVTTTRPTGRSS
jgi:predicted ATPase